MRACNDYMTYIIGDIPVGAYDATRLANIAIGHGAVDGGVGYTYFNPKTGQEFSGVLGFTYNSANHSTQYRNGVDMHFDWGASQFLTKQFQIGLVGTSTTRSAATAGLAIASAAFSRASSASDRKSVSLFPSAPRRRAI